MKLYASSTDPPLNCLMASHASGKKVDIKWDKETYLEDGTLKLSAQGSICRYLARNSPENKLYGTNILQECEVDHWISFSIGPLSCQSEFDNCLAYLDQTLAPVTYLVGNAFSLADIVIWSSLFSHHQFKKLLAIGKVPTNIIRWFQHIESLDITQMSLKSLPEESKLSQVSSDSGRKEEGKFVELPGAEMGKVVVRFPPEASGYLHIGHAKAALLNQYYRDAFNGKLIMRFDDTNPAKEKVDFEKVILEDLEMLKVKPDMYTHTSNYFDIMLEMCERLIKQGKAYVDDTDPAVMKIEREQKVESKNRSNPVEKNLQLWKEMQEGTSVGETCCVRAKIDMQSVNGCLRDPTIYRCKNEPHPRTGTKYKVYPTYDFACPIVDSIEGVTHCLRTTEYHDRDEQFFWFIEALGLRKLHIYEYSRLNMTNTVLSKRKLTWFVENNYVKGWDDPRMPTVRGVLRRGMTVEGLKQFIVAQGSSRSVVVMEWDKIWAINKKIIDPIVPRYNAVEAVGRVLVKISNVTESTIKVARHPKNPDVGEKTVHLGPEVFIDGEDAQQLREGENVTFINWGNIKITKLIKKIGKVVEVLAEPNLDNKDYKKTMKITWIAKSANPVPVVCVYFDHIISKPILGKDEDFKKYIGHPTKVEVLMIGDPELENLQKSEIIQIQRKGFFICDQPKGFCVHSTTRTPVVLFSIPDGHTKNMPSVADIMKIAKYNSPSSSRGVTDAEFISSKIIELGDRIRQMKADKVDKNVLAKEIDELLSLKAEYKEMTGRDWIPALSTSVPPSAATDPSAISEKITAQGNKVRELKSKKEPKAVIDKEVKVLIDLKAQYKTLTHKDWTPSASAPASSPVSSPSADSNALSDKIAAQGNKVRELKSKKEPKDVIDKEVKVLLQLKSEYKSSTGKDWTPSASAPASSPVSLPSADSSELSDKIAAQGNKVRELKSKKEPKDVIDKEVKVLLQLKSEYKSLTGKDWTPSASAPSSSPAPSPPADSNALSDKIVAQGNKVRDLKSNKAAKDVIEKEVKVLLQLKSDYKSLTGSDWTPSVNAPSSNSSVNEKNALNVSQQITDQGNKVRDLKKAKANKEEIDKEVKVLLSLKSEYKTITGKDWSPNQNQTPPAENKQPSEKPGQNTQDIKVVELNDKVVTQGNKIRDLKSNKAPKGDIDREVKVLLSLKEEFKNAFGQPWSPEVLKEEVKEAPKAKADPALSPSGDDEESLTKKVKEQGNRVRELKSKGAPKEDIDAAVQMLLSLKESYKSLTGKEFPSETRTPKSKGKKNEPSPKPEMKKPPPSAGVKKVTRLGLEATKEENLPDWYSQVITKGELIEYYDVSGCYILRPWSFAIWEVLRDWFDQEIKKIGIKNCYFPIFVSKSVLEKEKAHIEDFAPEVAWVTKSGDSDLAEHIAIRPTSETVMYPAYAKWVQSYRDLPIKLNQWNNVVRWEFKHPQPFLRTREFLWQEGHTAFATAEEAKEEVQVILDLYAKIYTDLLAIPVVKGRKTEKEKFAGGDYTYTVEAYISASGRAIQGATSHYLGQNFSKMFEIVFDDPQTTEKTFVYQNSWGFTTRTIGVMIMVHADNNGLVLPPQVASIQVVIVPCGISVSLSASEKDQLLDECKKLEKSLSQAGIKVHCDHRDNYSPGWKFNHWELKGVPLRVEIGPKDLKANQIVAIRRDNGGKSTIPLSSCVDDLKKLLNDIQSSLLEKATKELNEHMVVCKDWSQFCQQLDKKCILLSPFCGRIECEEKIKQDSARDDAEADAGAPAMGAKSLCIPFDQPAPIQPDDECIYPSCSSKPQFYTLFGRSY